MEVCATNRRCPPRSADFLVCCIADFPVGRPSATSPRFRSCYTAQVRKPATQQTWKSALQIAVARLVAQTSQSAVSPTSQSADRSPFPNASALVTPRRLGNLRHSRLGSLRYKSPPPTPDSVCAAFPGAGLRCASKHFAESPAQSAETASAFHPIVARASDGYRSLHERLRSGKNPQTTAPLSWPRQPSSKKRFAPKI